MLIGNGSPVILRLYQTIRHPGRLTTMQFEYLNQETWIPLALINLRYSTRNQTPQAKRGERDGGQQKIGEKPKNSSPIFKTSGITTGRCHLATCQSPPKWELHEMYQCR